METDIFEQGETPGNRKRLVSMAGTVGLYLILNTHLEMTILRSVGKLTVSGVSLATRLQTPRQDRVFILVCPNL